MNENIKLFIEKRPEVVAAFGYGSGIFKQNGYNKKDNPQIDLILVVNDLKKWHLDNMKLNKKDYSIIGSNFFKNKDINKLKGNTGITYLSNIKFNNATFKYGTIEYKDLLDYLYSWESFYVPGRFQKTLYFIKEDEKLTNAIKYNREMALMLASFLTNKKECNKKDILIKLCSLSYIGDTRMKFAENPKKIVNIVEGSYDEFNKIYDFNTKYLKEDNDLITIDLDYIKKNLKKLPTSLYKYIKEDIDKTNDDIISKITNYFVNLNKEESTKQTLKGISTNGLLRSINYASKKIGKRFKKK